MVKKEVKKTKETVKKPAAKKTVATKKVEPKKVTAKKPKTTSKVAPKIAPVKSQKKVTEDKKKTPVVKKSGHYFEAVGRRKTAVARVRLYEKGKKDFLVNGKNIDAYFPLFGQRKRCLAPIEKTNFIEKYDVEVSVKGGGLNAQADAVCHGLARTLILLEPELRKTLRQFGYLTRDPRKRERKKFGLKSARRAPQWRKR